MQFENEDSKNAAQIRNIPVFDDFFKKMTTTGVFEPYLQYDRGYMWMILRPGRNQWSLNELVNFCRI